MFAAIASLTVLGAILGLGLGVAARKFAVEGDPLADEIAALMPGSNCGQCGMAGCAIAAKAIAEGSATATVCPPGGRGAGYSHRRETGNRPRSGRTPGRWWRPSRRDLHRLLRCLKICPTDAMIGAAKQIHSVIREACGLREMRGTLPHRGRRHAAAPGYAAALGVAETGECDQPGGSLGTTPWA